MVKIKLNRPAVLEGYPSKTLVAANDLAGLSYSLSREASKDTDVLIIERVLKGDKESFGHLVRRYQQRIFGLIVRQVRDQDLASELTQDVFIRAYRYLHKFRARSSFLTWLTRIALNVCHSYFASRRHKQSLAVSTLDSELDLCKPADTDPHIKERLICLLQQHLSDLPAKYRSVIVLCMFEGHSYSETAEILEIPEGTVCSRMHKALSKLRTKMEKYQK